MKLCLALVAALLSGLPALSGAVFAQVEEADPDRPAIIVPDGPMIIPPDTVPDPDLPPDASDLPDPDVSIPEAPTPQVETPDYSRLSSKEERAARLDDMFARLEDAQDPGTANLIAEEIWAVWLESGSASVNLVLRRGTDAQADNRNAQARALFDQVTMLEPDYAEGWARSSRLALEERDFSRAAGDAVRALTLEPRHFYALWTLGNVLERLGRSEQALEAYREANQLYPALESVSDRVDALELTLQGGVL